MQKACRLIDVPSQYAVALEDAPSGVRSGSGGRDACDRRARSGGAVGRDTGACMEAVRQSDGCDRDDIEKGECRLFYSQKCILLFRTGVYGIRTRKVAMRMLRAPNYAHTQRHIKIIALKRQEGKYRI